uniref:Uncharacterized protein n=1 Tax=Panagrolaimus sp. ES5 TaxID=591445 RepID=A0AC34GQ55_9BILA
MSKILCLRPRLPAFEIIISDVETLQEDYLYFNEIGNGNDLCQILLSTFPLEDICAILFAFKSENKKESEMAKEVEQLFQQLNIPFYCCSWKSVLVTATFLACIAEYGNEEMFEDKIDFIYCLQNGIHIFNLVKCGQFYRIQAETYATLDQIYDAKYVNAQKVFITILKEVPVEDISKQKTTQSMVINALAPTKDLVLINKSVHDYTTHGIVTIVPHTPNILNQLYSKYAVLQTSRANYFVIPAHRLSCVTPHKYKNESLISITTSEMIHVEKSIICYEEIDNIRFVDDTPHDDLIKLINCGTFKIGTTITLKIDKFFMPQMAVTREHNNLIKNGVIINLERNTFSIEIIFDGILFNVTGK